MVSLNAQNLSARWIGELRALRPFLALALTCLAGCAGFKGETYTLDADGPTSLKSENYKEPTSYDTRSSKPVVLFLKSYYKAYQDQEKAVENSQLAAPPSPASADALAMTTTGFDLVDAYCDEFFASAGANQKWLTVGKDLVAVVGTAATGVLGLASPANAAAAGAVALFTSTTYNGVDLYTRDFLFNADNIQSVRKLTFDALAAQRSSVLNNNESSTWSFGEAAEAIKDYQNICAPAAIRAIVTTAIKSGTVVAAPSVGTAFVNAMQSAADQSVKPATDAAAAAISKTTPKPAVATAAAAAGTAGAVVAVRAIVNENPKASFEEIKQAAQDAAVTQAREAAGNAGATATEAANAANAVADIVSPAIAAASTSTMPLLSSRHPSLRPTLSINGQTIPL